MATISTNWRTGRQGPDLEGLGAGHGSGGVLHHQSEARDELGVQPVGLGLLAFGDPERPDPLGIDDSDLEARLGQRSHQMGGVSSDRFQHHPANVLAPKALDHHLHALRAAGRAEYPSRRLQAHVEEIPADIHAGRAQTRHSSAPVFEPERFALRPCDCSEKQTDERALAVSRRQNQGPNELRPSAIKPQLDGTANTQGPSSSTLEARRPYAR